MRRLLSVALVLILPVLACLTILWTSWRPGLDQVENSYLPDSASASPLRATWFGVSAVLLDDGKHSLFIDPFFSRPGGIGHLLLNPRVWADEVRIRDWLQRAGIEKLDAVLVSHSHYDHAMDAGLVAELTGAQLIGSASTLNIGRGNGLAEDRLLEIADAEPIVVGDFQLRFIASAHAGATGGRPLGDIDQPLLPGARLLDYRQGGTYSILVEHEALSVLHHGSAGFVPGALAGFEADLAFLGVALIDDLDAYLDETVRATGAQVLIPVHWDDFTRPLDEPPSPMPFVVDLPDFFASTRSLPDMQVYTLPLGRPVRLPGRK